MKEEESIAPTENNYGLRGGSVPGEGGTGRRGGMDGAARKAAEGKEGRPRGRQEKRRRVLDPPTSARRANPLTGRGPATRGRPRGWSSGRADEAPPDIGTRDGGSPVLVARRNGRLRRLRAGPAPFGRHPIGTAANFKPCPSRRGVSNGEGWDTYAGRRRVGGRGTLLSASVPPPGRGGCTDEPTN